MNHENGAPALLLRSRFARERLFSFCESRHRCSSSLRKELVSMKPALRSRDHFRALVGMVLKIAVREQAGNR
jgi:hypothetical protein